ncbi:unnamed protein product, partial [Ectocarpus sp. 8 AP-2014]
DTITPSSAIKLFVHPSTTPSYRVSRHPWCPVWFLRFCLCPISSGHYQPPNILRSPASLVRFRHVSAHVRLLNPLAPFVVPLPHYDCLDVRTFSCLPHGGNRTQLSTHASD